MTARPRRTALVAILALVPVLASCAGGDEGATPSGSTTSAATASTGSSSVPSTPITRPAAPQGWQAVTQDELVFALPPGFVRRPAGSGMGGAAAQWTRTGDPKLAVPPAVAVFVETGRVGSLAVRTTLLSTTRSAQLGAQPVGDAVAVDVPGSQGAARLEWSWDYVVQAGQPAVPSRQVELVVQTAGERQFGVLIGAPKAYLTDAMVDAFVASIAVLPVGGAL